MMEYTIDELDFYNMTVEIDDEDPSLIHFSIPVRVIREPVVITIAVEE